jgi:hypothetical protein
VRPRGERWPADATDYPNGHRETGPVVRSVPTTEHRIGRPGDRNNQEPLLALGIQTVETHLSSQPEGLQVGFDSESKIRVRRRPTAVFATNVAGYSRVARRAESETLLAFRKTRTIPDALIEEHIGHIADTAGDSVARIPKRVERLPGDDSRGSPGSF